MPDLRTDINIAMKADVWGAYKGEVGFSSGIQSASSPYPNKHCSGLLTKCYRYLRTADSKWTVEPPTAFLCRGKAYSGRLDLALFLVRCLAQSSAANLVSFATGIWALLHKSSST